MEIDREKLLNLLKSRAKYIRTHRDIAEAGLCLVGYIVTVAIAFQDILSAVLWQKAVIAFIGCLYLAAFLYSLFTDHYSIETLFREICACNNNHRFTLVLLKNKRRFLLKYDKRWKAWLFPYTKTNSDNDLFDFIRYDIGFEPVEITKQLEKDETKYSVSAGMTKTYHHTFSQVSFNGDCEKEAFKCNSTKYKWFSIDEMKQNKKIMDTNKETVSFVEMNF